MRAKDMTEILEIEPETDMQALVMNLFINEGRLREQEEIIELLMQMKNVTCCCDTATFGDHYLAHNQPDNIIDMIRNREIKDAYPR